MHTRVERDRQRASRPVKYDITGTTVLSQHYTSDIGFIALDCILTL